MSRALLIGINYINTPNQLQGCIYDVIEMKSVLIDAYGFNPNNIITLRDDDPANMPTRARILQEIQALVTNAGPLFLHYSGHGTQVTDTTGTEIDSLTECIVPCDYSSAGLITDDQLNASIKGLKGLGIALFDCCRSGTILDLPCTGIDSNNLSVNQGFYCFSGCQDSQNTYESTTSTQGSGTGLPQGSTTMAFIATIRALNYYPTLSKLFDAMAANLKQGGYVQTPQLTSTIMIGSATPFPFNSPNQQLVLSQALVQQQKTVIADLQTQNQQLHAQLDLAQPQAALVPALQDQVQTLSVIQKELEVLQIQDASNQVLINALQEGLILLPTLREQADTASVLQNQVSLIPELQQQMEGLMSQLQSQIELQKLIFNLQTQNAVLQNTIEQMEMHTADLQNTIEQLKK